MSGKIQKSQKFTFCSRTSAFIFSESFRCLTNNAFLTILDLSKDNAHCKLARISIQYERLSQARERHNWAGSDSDLQNFKTFQIQKLTGFRTSRENPSIPRPIAAGDGLLLQSLSLIFYSLNRGLTNFSHR